MSAGLRALWWSLAVTIFALTALALERKITWYLSVDQFGYATFARDLRAGRVFHEWPPATALAPLLPARTDVLVQTYVYDRGRLYCRYAPGFPILLAGWLAIFGEDAAHYLNPTLFVVMVALLIALQRRLFHARWRALVGGALLVLLPTLVHLWGLTLTRDIAAHLFAFAGIFLLIPWGGRRLAAGRTAAVGLLLGFSASVRPDGVLYLLPAAVLAGSRWRAERTGRRVVLNSLAAGAVAMAVGIAPLLAYDWLATGSPFKPTQGMEVGTFLGAAPPPGTMLVAERDDVGLRVGYPSGGWRGGTVSQVQGGGLRLAHLRHTLPGNLALLHEAYGWTFLAAAVWGAAVALTLRPFVFFASALYVAGALLFYSCWSHPDTRYLIGMHLFLTLVIVEGLLGTFDLVRRLARRRPPAARALALGAALAWLAAAALVGAPQQRSALPTLTCLVPAILAAGAMGAAAWPRRRVVGLVAPVLALALTAVAVSRVTTAPGRSSFQRPQVLRARANLQRVLEPGAVVITTEDVGRPAENIEYYSGVAHALYLTDLARWHMPLGWAAVNLLRGRMRPYLLVSAEQQDKEQMLAALRGAFTVELVDSIPAERAIEYFVHGFPMELYRISAPGLERPRGAAH